MKCGTIASIIKLRETLTDEEIAGRLIADGRVSMTRFIRDSNQYLGRCPQEIRYYAAMPAADLVHCIIWAAHQTEKWQRLAGGILRRNR